MILQAHPKIAIPPETRFLLPTYYGRERFGDLDQVESRKELADAIVGSKRTQFHDLGLDPNEIRDRIVKGATTVGSAIGLVFRAYAERFGKLRWGDKRPSYHTNVWVVRRLFPDAQFIHIVRDGRDCVASMKGHPYWQYNPYGRIQRWTEVVEYASSLQRTLRPDTYYELQYEQLVRDPEKQLPPLCEFLGERFEEGMLSPQAIADQVVPERQSWHANTHQPISATSIGKFHDGLKPWELELCEAVMGDQLRRFGYELTGAPAPAEEHCRAYRELDDKRRRKVRQQRKKDRAVMDTRPVADLIFDAGHQDERVAELEQRVAKVSRQRDALRSRLDRTLNSRTWRWSKPLRTAARMARGRP